MPTSTATPTGRKKYDIAERTGAKVKLVWVKTDEEEARKRATVEAGEHPEHRPFGNMDPDTFERLIGQIEPPKDEEQAIIIDGNDLGKEKNPSGDNLGVAKHQADACL